MDGTETAYDSTTRDPGAAATYSDAQKASGSLSALLTTPAAGAIEALRFENAQLREALREQWAMTHAERCTDEWPHPPLPNGPCWWPPPAVLGRVI